MKNEEKKGYVLVLTVVLTSLLLFLSASFIPLTMGIVDFQKRKEAEQEMALLKEGIIKYYEDTGILPTALTDLGNPVQVAGILQEPLPGWKGPYFMGVADEAFSDGWRMPYQYNFTPPLAGVGQMVLLLSTGRNRQINSNLDNWWSSGWQPAGDDIAEVFSTALATSTLINKTQQLLFIAKGQIYVAFPSAPPATYVLPIRDPWGNLLLYRNCHRFGSVVYSMGQNGTDDSNFGYQMCLLGRAGGDDIFVPLLWDISAQATGQVWKGGWGGNPDVCASYRITIWNLYSNRLRVDYKDLSYTNHTVYVAPNSSTTLSSLPPLHRSQWVVNVSYQGDPIEGFHPSLLDLDSDCQGTKIYGFEF